MQRKDIIEQIRKKLKDLPLSASVILYGSEAREEARPDSDVDLLIIVNQEKLSEKEKQNMINPLFEIEYEAGVLINPIVILKNQWDEMITPFHENVIKEGIVL